jgi:nucleotide-binding universal stress UspA family protein
MNTILCPTDFSKCADNAIAYANQLAIRAQAKLILVHSIYVPQAMPYVGPYGGISVHPEISYGDAIQEGDELVHICQQLKEQAPHANVSYECITGCRPTIDEITHIADKNKVDLLVMGTTGAHGLKEIVLGSTTAQVIEATKRPVLVVPQTAAFSPVKRIVVAVDLREDHAGSLSSVLSIAKLFDSEILFLHVLKEKDFVKDSLASIQYDNWYSLINYGKVSFHTWEEKDIEQGILQFSQEKKADLIAMINHTRGFWASIFGSSHTREMAYYTPVPLLAIHP